MIILGEPILLGGGESASIWCTGDVLQTDTVTATKGSKTRQGKWVRRNNPSAHNLPNGYTEVTYIRSSGTQYIDTGIIPTNNCEIEIKMQFIQKNKNVCVFGQWLSPSFVLVWDNNVSGGAFRTIVNGTSKDNAGLITVNHDYTLKGVVSSSAFDFYIDDTDVYTQAGTMPSTFVYSLYLFARHNSSGADAYSSAIVYEIKYTENGDVVKRLIPCKRDSDGAYGMYDVESDASDAFLPNLGTGVFTAGSEIPTYIYGFEIANINEYGTWTVADTTQSLSENVVIDMATEYQVELEAV